MTWDSNINLTGAISATLSAASNRGLSDAAEHVLQVARTRAPIEEGTLERSGTVSTDPGNLTAAVSFDTPYAVRQHEEMDWQHDAGRQPKYLESALTGEATTAGKIIADAIRKGLGT